MEVNVSKISPSDSPANDDNEDVSESDEVESVSESDGVEST